MEKTVAAGGSDTETFVLNVRLPEIAAVRLALMASRQGCG